MDDLRGSGVRAPAVAGHFYPAEAGELRRVVGGLLERGAGRARAFHAMYGQPRVKALIAPHAGYACSGPVAGSAYALAAGREVRRVVLVGPAHEGGFNGLATVSHTALATPLGEVPVDRAALDELCDLRFVHPLDWVHEEEHSLEVQLPFLQIVLRDWSVVPLACGECDGQQVATVLGRLWGGAETMLVVSSDLSHYHPAAEAEKLDRATALAIEKLAAAEIDEHRACGWRGIQGLLIAAARHKLRAVAVDVRNSGDTAGGHEEVVGYGAFAFLEREGGRNEPA